jgi:tetratricopeptide (TPR) repeat protein
VEPGPSELNLAGVAKLKLKDYEGASEAFQSLFDTGADDPSIRFNLAWSRAMLKDQERALMLLDETVTAALPQAAMLEVQLLHDRGEFERAIDQGRRHMVNYPDHPGLNAAVSVLAIDVGDEELARSSALLGGGHPDALTTLGTLALNEDRATDALVHFEQALAMNEGVPRAWIGRGLAKLLSENPSGASADLDRGAEFFDDHSGSWIAAGWSHLIEGDTKSSRDRFKRALVLDPDDAEAHGSLAAVSAIEGKIDEAIRHIELALGLDPQCFAAAVAKTLIASSEGDEEGARALLRQAFGTPIDKHGKTIAQMIARHGLLGN